jgi:type IV pilus assembly protein PilC
MLHGLQKNIHKSIQNLFQIRREFSQKEQALVLRKLSLYLSAHMSLVQSIRYIEEETQHVIRRRSYALWRICVEEGKPLSRGFEPLDEDLGGAVGGRVLCMSRGVTAAVHLGEQTGALADTLAQASVAITSRLELKKKVLSAIAYPAFVLAGTCVLAGALMVFVFPKIIPLFESMKVDLPLSTRFLIALSGFVSQYWWFLGALVFLSVLVVYVLCKTLPTVLRSVEWVLPRIPVVGRLYVLWIVVHVFSSLHMLMRGGKQFSDAVQDAGQFVRHHEYKILLNDLSVELRSGRSATEVLQRNSRLIPRFVSGVLSAGERSGTVEASLDHIARIAKEELEDALRICTAAVEPVLMVSMALVIGFIAISIILPIYGITTHFQSV